jgi:hypothetical protein
MRSYTVLTLAKYLKGTGRETLIPYSREGQGIILVFGSHAKRTVPFVMGYGAYFNKRCSFSLGDQD